ncbi:TPA: bifunctional isocitrate dehydrogenase kinase/phosphatase [Providencia stuartii]|uniref:Isocitrate dehydrogenase kinase/phosphatase n=3 Tax=Providencia stuartii TaxID=588 RepID=A0AAJ1NBD9_PROST|nr:MULTISPECIES: bifunctional isocitrate dehydrogenase kinase/phosphatase [Providencia]EDU57965.1 [isocitrate dehydrogenase (NADP(+))] kinase [Providencia stuartii ATCC 25827]SST05200.1 Isocitrate dehydrogenase kinase/phosphatase [Acinetobacter baumannii]AFH93556.1 bifunctional isocitrate dehydrogenase kinase/phosphatase protein [Providencia stuartii MRSN 2154]AIN65242.1 isocitrate dehydrogenase kinase/phosphatase [Providencia stuartii]AMG68072.1 bifunctional isocitrate dehydrogenase kinase/ph
MTLSTEQIISQTILQGFDAQYGRFLEITSGAQERFERADWHAIQDAMKQRIQLYDHHVGLVVAQLQFMGLVQSLTPEMLSNIKRVYTALLPHYPRFEIAESFFNSVYCRLFQHRELTQDNLFIFTSQPARRFSDLPRPLAREYPVKDSLFNVLEEVLSALPLRLQWRSLSWDVQCIVESLIERFPNIRNETVTFQIANELFYRNKAAWLVGKLVINNEVHPFLLPIHHDADHKIYVDTCLTGFDEASIVFGFARSYFMVYAPFPAALVFWLREILPSKSIAELYMAIGCQKHGKTEYYREYLAFINFSREQFTIAPGVKGMVMLVFTSPSFDRVFKLIKDEFAPQKEVTRERVQECYRLVKEHDRVGRMADTQEFENFIIEKRYISDELMAELLKEAPSLIEDLGDKILIRHLYMERKMTPLNIYMDEADEAQLHHVIDEYGQAIKQLAAANIFPGDMLFKNFGVTRHGRVVFYDYDEICYMTEVNFRKIPEPMYPEQELSGEPWYSVGEQDVFPEEFALFLCQDPKIRGYLQKRHANLFTAEYWQGLQNRIRSGYIEDVYAYREDLRFSLRFGQEPMQRLSG